MSTKKGFKLGAIGVLRALRVLLITPYALAHPKMKF
jgi:hypothetical protein